MIKCKILSCENPHIIRVYVGLTFRDHAMRKLSGKDVCMN